MVDDDTFISLCDKESYFHKDEYNFYSFFALEDVTNLSLKGFKYELEDYTLSHSSNLGVSNEIIGNMANVSYSKGKLLLIKTKE
jgi:thiamine pyrophosphokinase